MQELVFFVLFSLFTFHLYNIIVVQTLEISVEMCHERIIIASLSDDAHLSIVDILV